MGIKTQKVLRLISKIILILVGVGLVGIAGYYAYKSIAFKPQNVVVTNITDGSATVTWTTSSPMKGIVYVKKDKGLLPGPLGIIGSAMAYDDRDVSDAQKACVDAFNKKASETKDSTFSVSGSDFDCENVKVTKMGSYYTHSITMTNLDENSTYNFVVGDGIWSFKENVSTVKTFSVLETVGEPEPIFGKVIGDDKTVSKDGLVYITFNDGSESKDSIVYSSTTNDDGGWYLDASNVRDAQGNVLTLELTNDTFKLKGIYSNYGVSGEEKYILGYFNGAYPDVVVKKAVISSSWLNNLVGKAYATYITPKTCTGSCAAIVAACPKCANSLTVEQVNTIAKETASGSSSTLAGLATTLGTGNAAKISASLNGGVVDFAEIGVSKNFGNINSLVGATVTTSTNVENVTVSYSGGAVSATATAKTTEASSSTVTTCTNNGCGTTTVSEAPGGSGTGSTQTDTPTKCSYKGGYCEGRTKCNSDGTTTTYTYDGCINQYVAPACTSGTCYGYQLCSGGKLTSTPGSCGLPKVVECTSSTGVCESLENGTSRKCVGSVYAYYDTSICANKSVSTSSSNVTDRCMVTASYATVGERDLDHCNMSCVDGKSITVSSGKCTAILPTVPQTAPSAAISINVLASEINLSALNVARIKKLIAESDDLQNAIDDKVLNLEKASEYQPEEVCYSSDGSTTWSDFVKYCESLGKNPTKNCSATGEKYSCNDSAAIKIAPSKVFAAETASSDSYTFFMPEYGMYSFELGENTVSTQISDGKTVYLFYVESNGRSGFQMPVDQNNPTSDEDIVLSSSASQITYKQESTAQKYELKKGINIVSFNFVPVSTSTGAYTAKDIISQASTNGVEVQYISTFEGGRWNSGYSCSSDTCTGSNFTIVPGKGYLVYATQDGTVTIPGYNLTSSVPIAFSAGWNLVGVHGYTTAYTARSFIDSINKIEGLTANNVSWWPTSKSKYEGLEVDNGTQYGLDFSMSPNNGYFVRISKFAPTETKCKSLIWNAGGSLNGTCGNTK